MKIHLTPKLYTSEKKIELQSVSIPQLNLNLDGKNDVRLWSAKDSNLKNACQKNTRGNINGFLIHSSEWLFDFDVITRWSIAGWQVTHHVQYTVKDSDHDFVSDNPYLWFGSSPSLGNWETRMPHHSNKIPISSLESVMEYESNIPSYSKSNVTDHRDYAGNLHRRYQNLRIPTIQQERLLENRLGIINPSLKKMIRA